MLNDSIYINHCGNYTKKNEKKTFGLYCFWKLHKNVKNMLFLYQNKKNPKKIYVLQINSFIVDILINGFSVVIVFVYIKCFFYNIVNDKFVWILTFHIFSFSFVSEKYRKWYEINGKNHMSEHWLFYKSHHRWAGYTHGVTSGFAYVTHTISVFQCRLVGIDWQVENENHSDWLLLRS